jgi:DnaD/phage-associated family protein
MKQFRGFPARMEYAPVPAVFFSALLPEIDDMAELKTTLHLFRVLYRKKGYPRYVTYGELAGDPALIAGLQAGNIPPEQVLRSALNTASNRGTFIHLVMKRNGAEEDLYFLNSARDREAVDRIRNGEIRLPGIEPKPAPEEAISRPKPNIFALYEENIGMLTPIIAEELKEAEKLYPEQWLADAFKEAVNANRRSWRFVAFLLERWATEGKKDGTYRRNLKATDPDKYVKDRYGEYFQR